MLVANNTVAYVQEEAVIIARLSREKNEVPIRLINARDYDSSFNKDLKQFRLEINSGKSSERANSLLLKILGNTEY